MGARRPALLLAAEPRKVKVGILELTSSAPVFVDEALKTLPR